MDMKHVLIASLWVILSLFIHVGSVSAQVMRVAGFSYQEVSYWTEDFLYGLRSWKVQGSQTMNMGGEGGTETFTFHLMRGQTNGVLVREYIGPDAAEAWISTIQYMVYNNEFAPGGRTTNEPVDMWAVYTVGAPRWIGSRTETEGNTKKEYTSSVTYHLDNRGSVAPVVFRCRFGTNRGRSYTHDVYVGGRTLVAYTPILSEAKRETGKSASWITSLGATLVYPTEIDLWKKYKQYPNFRRPN
jgi:hypothetical protein